MGGFQNLSINTIIYTTKMQWEFNAVPTSHANVLAVWTSLVWVDRNHE